MPLTKVTYAMIDGAPINVLDWDAVGDGVTDNTAAFTALSTWVNTQPRTGVPFPIYFPAGTYKYGVGGLNFEHPVTLFSDEGATLYYTGVNSNAIDLGKPGLNYGDFLFDNAEYTVDGLRITSDYGCNHGIYLRPFVLSARIRNVVFYDFGGNAGTTGYCIFGQTEIWDTVIENCRLLATVRLNANVNFIGFPGVSTGGVRDGGNSRVTMSDCMMTSFATGPAIDLGVYALISGTQSRILGGSFVNSSYGILLDSQAQGVIIDGVYAEMASNALAYVTAASLTSGGITYYPSNARILNAYIRFNNLNIPLVKCFDAGMRFINWEINNVLLGEIVNNQILIDLQDGPGQTGNVATGIKIGVPSTVPGNGFQFQVIPPGLPNAETWADPSNVFEIDEITGSYTLQQQDAGTLKRLTGAAAVVTVPPSTTNPNIRVGSIIYLSNATGGNQTIVGGSGVTLSLTGTATTGTRTIGANGLARLINIQSNIWLVDGPNVT
jgi:hypothetical protein